MPEEWTERVVGERMAVDQEFNDRVRNSEFSNQEWSLVMSAVQYTIEDPGNPERASIVVDREATNLDAIMPELENIQEQMGALGGAGGGKSDVGGNSGGLFDGVKNALGLGNGGSSGTKDYSERAASARSLAGEYGQELQAHLESKGRWEEICAVAAAGAPSSDGASRSAGADDDAE